MKVLIDVNVILDVLLNRQPWVMDSVAVWDANYEGRIRGFLVATEITNLYYVARKLVGHPLALRGVCDCVAAFNVLSVDGDVLNDAAKLPGTDFEDNVSIRCAVGYEIDLIVTRDLKGFLQSPVPAVSPTEFLAHLAAIDP